MNNVDIVVHAAVFSLEPDEFKVMVKSVREVEKALGKIF